MIDVETVFILGSGASKPYDFPTDTELRMRIIEKFKDDYSRLPYTSDLNSRFIVSMKNVRVKEAEEFIKRLLDTEGTTTIDEFISINNQFEFIGKIAIQYYLLESERDYLTNRDNGYTSDWFEVVLRKMLIESKEYKNPSLADLNNVTFLTFNYDRLIEFLFIRQFRSLFLELLNDNINKNQIDFFLYKIIHVFGSIGVLPPKSEITNSSYVGFGEIISTYERIKETIPNIRLIKDGFRDNDRIRKKIFNAKKIYFLGVGYIEKNMKLLDLEKNLNYDNPPQIYGTAFEKNHVEITEIKNKYFNFSKRFPEPIIDSVTCKELLGKYF